MLPLSVLPPSMSVPVIVTFPVTSNWSVMSWQIATGGWLSVTVTVASHVLVFPDGSSTVNVTV